MQKVIEIVDDKEYRVRYLKYSQRVLSCFKTTFIFYFILLVVIGMMSSFINALYVIGFFFVLNFFEYRSWSRFFITSIRKTAGILYLEYYDGDEKKNIEGDIALFSFEVKRLWYKIRGDALYLAVTYQGELKLKQFLIEDVDEGVIRKVVDMMNDK
jgi:hypothetical protein